MAVTLTTGDRVGWNTPQGRTRGIVREIRTSDFEIDEQHFTASADEPAYIVESEMSGARAAHKRAALRKIS